MSKEILYLAVLSRWDLKLLSVKEDKVNKNLTEIFQTIIFPEACEKVKGYIEFSYDWATAIVVVADKVYCVTTSAGMLFPSRDEIQREIKKKSCLICELKAGKQLL